MGTYEGKYLHPLYYALLLLKEMRERGALSLYRLMRLLPACQNRRRMRDLVGRMEEMGWVEKEMGRWLCYRPTATGLEFLRRAEELDLERMFLRFRSLGKRATGGRG